MSKATSLMCRIRLPQPRRLNPAPGCADRCAGACISGNPATALIFINANGTPPPPVSPDDGDVNTNGRAGRTLSAVMAGLVPAIPLGRAPPCVLIGAPPCVPERDRRHKGGDDKPRVSVMAGL